MSQVVQLCNRPIVDKGASLLEEAEGARFTSWPADYLLSAALTPLSHIGTN